MPYRNSKDVAGNAAKLPATAQQSILVVEDDVDQRELLSDLLALNGYRVISAENGKEALEALSRAPIPPALILLDLMMPVMDGKAFLQRFRKDEPGIPVLVMTGEISPMVSGAAAVLSKPLKPATILSSIKQFLA